MLYNRYIYYIIHYIISKYRISYAISYIDHGTDRNLSLDEVASIYNTMEIGTFPELSRDWAI